MIALAVPRDDPGTVRSVWSAGQVDLTGRPGRVDAEGHDHLCGTDGSTKKEKGWTMATLEIIDRFGRHGRHVEMVGDSLTVGRGNDCDVVVDTDDNTVSSLHAQFDRVGTRWAIKDAGSTNGTFVNKARIHTDQMLRDGDEIRLGQSSLRYRNGKEKAGTTTDPIAPPPKLTPREFDVLRELVRPRLTGGVFIEAASRAQIAEALFVGEGAVQAHLDSLYRKFDIDADDTRTKRRTRLANEAIRRGAIGPGDLEDPDAES